MGANDESIHDDAHSIAATSATSVSALSSSHDPLYLGNLDSLINVLQSQVTRGGSEPGPSTSPFLTGALQVDQSPVSGIACAHTEVVPKNQVNNKAEGGIPYSKP